MKRIFEMHQKWMEDEAYREEYDALEVEHASASVISNAKQRTRGGQKKEIT
jgi:hypothetical protein